MTESKFNEQKKTVHCRDLPLVSIIITSYNYEKFLPRAIDSALQQTYPKKEVIVVDDGSTDNSPQIIKGYGNQILPVFQENGGVVSATNAGFLASRGEIIFFLDADDIFFPHKVETMVNYFLQVMPQTPDALILHRLKMTTDTDDKNSVLVKIPNTLCALDGKKKNGSFVKLSDPETAYQYIQKWRFFYFNAPPTSSFSMTRSLANKIFPLPDNRVIPQDAFLIHAARLLGTVYGASQVLCTYFIHGKNFTLSHRWPGKVMKGDHTLDNFLNNILDKMNKKRVASFFESRQAQIFYKHAGLTKDLLKLAWKIPTNYFCWETMWFSIQTLWHCLRSALGIKKSYRNKREKLLSKKTLTTQHHQQQSSGAKGD